jgi:hypothetical protein
MNHRFLWKEEYKSRFLPRIPPFNYQCLPSCICTVTAYGTVLTAPEYGGKGLAAITW